MKNHFPTLLFVACSALSYTMTQHDASAFSSPNEVGRFNLSNQMVSTEKVEPETMTQAYGASSFNQNLIVNSAGTVNLTIKWDFVNNTDPAHQQVDSYAQFTLIDSDGNFIAVKPQDEIYRKRNGNSFVMQVKPGIYDGVMGMMVKRDGETGMSKYVIRENVNIQNDTTLSFSGASATKQINFRFLMPDGDRVRIPQRINNVHILDSINATSAVRAVSIMKKESQFTQGVISTIPFWQSKYRRPDEWCDILINEGVSSRYQFGAIFFVNKSAPGTPYNQFSDGNSEVLMTMGATADMADTTIVLDTEKFIQFTPDPVVHTPGDQKLQNPFCTQNYPAFTGTNLGITRLTSYTKSSNGTKWLCNNNPDKVITVMASACAESPDKIPNPASGIFTPWGIVNADGSVDYVMNFSIENFYITPFVIPGTSNPINLTSGHDFYAFNNKSEKPAFGTSAPLFTLPVAEKAVTTSSLVKAPNLNKFDLPHFIGNYGESRSIDIMVAKWSAFADNEELIKEDTYEKMFNSLTNHYKTAHETGHQVKIVMDHNNYLIGDITGHHHAEITFKENGEDVVPPTMMIYRLSNKAGSISHVFDDGTGMLSFSYADLSKGNFNSGYVRSHCDAKVEVAAHGTNAFKELPTTEKSEFFDPYWGWFRQGEISASSLGEEPSGWYDLRFTVSDNSGNSQTQTLSPAFYAKNDKGGISDGITDNIDVEVEDGSIRINGAQGMPITLFSVDGKVLYKVAEAPANCLIGTTQHGIYIVRVGNKCFKVLGR